MVPARLVEMKCSESWHLFAAAAAAAAQKHTQLQLSDSRHTFFFFFLITMITFLVSRPSLSNKVRDVLDLGSQGVFLQILSNSSFFVSYKKKKHKNQPILISLHPYEIIFNFSFLVLLR